MSFFLLTVTQSIQAQNVLDNVGLSTTASAAFGLRKVASGYTGAIIRVRRSTDNAEADVVFDASNELSATSGVRFIPGITLLNTNSFTVRTGTINTTIGSTSVTGVGTSFTALGIGDVLVDDNARLTIGIVASITDNFSLTLLTPALATSTNTSFKTSVSQTFGTFYAGASTNCSVKIWYDQSGNAKNAIAPSDTSQPFIIQNGVLRKINNKPSIIWTLETQVLECNVKTKVQTVTAVRNLYDTTIVSYAFQTLFASPASNAFSIIYGYKTGALDGNDWVTNTGAVPTNWVNGEQTMKGTKALHTLTASAKTLKDTSFSISRNTRGLKNNIGVSEMILFPGLFPESDRQILECNQFTYFSIVNPLLAFTNQNTTICSGKAFNTTTNNSNIKFTWAAPVIAPLGAVSGGSEQVTAIATCSQTLTNLTNNPATATYTVTPTLCGVSGTPFTVTVTINPLPTTLPTITPDYCTGNGFVMLTSSIGTAYLWSTGQTTQTINVANSGTYSVATSQGPYGCASVQSINVAQELVVNGSFNAGATGFSTAYTNNQASLIAEGTYAVSTNAKPLHPVFYGTDHTTGTGNFMIVNSNNVGANVWSTQSSLTVSPNTTYYFSAWALTVNNSTNALNNAVLQFSINNIQTGSIAYLPNGYTNTAGPYTWVRFFGQWNSGPQTTVDLRIVNLNTTGSGNDFGLDDISFGTLSPVALSALPTQNSGNAACQGDTLYLNSNVIGGASPYSYSWTGPNSFLSSLRNPIVKNSAGTGDAGVYTLTATDGFGCQVTANTTVTIASLPADKVTAATVSPLCVGGSSGINVLTTEIGVSYQLKNALNQFIGDPLPGNGASITLPSGIMNSSNTFSVLATTDNTGCNVAMTNPVTITVSTTPVLKITNQAICSGTVDLTLAGVTNGSTGSGTLTYWTDAAASVAVPTPSSIGTSGKYFIKSTAGSCSDIEPVVVSISLTPSSTFSYTGSPFCSNSNNPVPTTTGVAGTFSSTAGLVFVNTSTGEIDLAASTAGTYNITNTVAPSGCTASTTTVPITITKLPKAGFSYGATNDLCKSINVANLLPTLVDPSTSAVDLFTTTTGLNITSSATGAINIGTSTPGNYAIWRTIPASGGCPLVADTIFVDINPYTNTGIVFTSASDSTICQGASINLYSTPLPYVSVLFREKFNSNVISWLRTNNSTAGTPSSAAWTSRSHNYNDGSLTHNSNDNSGFFNTSSLLQGSGSTTETILRTNTMSTIGFSTLRLDFFHFFRRTSNGVATVEVSINNASWTPVLTFTTNQGANNGFVNSSVNLDAYIGNANFYIRFRYNAQFDGSWAIDNISLTGNSTNYTYAWSSFPAGFTSSVGNPVATPPSNSFYVLNAINSYGCSQPAVPVPVSVFAAQTLSNVLQPNVACIGTGTTVNLQGLVPGNTSTVSYTIDGVAQTPVAGVVADASGNASFTSSTLSAANNGQMLMVTALDNGSCVAPFTKSLTINVQTQITWSGTINNDWFDAQNWCGGIPTASTNILIPNGRANYPILTAGTGSVKDITIQNNASLIINAGKLTISGAIANAGTFNALNGIVEMNGTTAQSITGNVFFNSTLSCLRVSNTSVSGLSISNAVGNQLKIMDSLCFGVSNATLNTGDNLVLLSNLLGTARVADITNNGLNTGNNIVGLTTVERFFPGLRSWRLITSPLNSKGTTATIFSQWQNNGVNTTGIGTLITGPNADNAINGLDPSANNGVSLRTFKNNGYVNIVNTLVPLCDTTVTSAANIGYFMFVRGDRDPLNFVLPNFNTTTLISKGKLQLGPQTFAGYTRPAADGIRYYALIGNPYASPVDFNLLSRVNLIKRFIVWDPKLGPVGAFVTLDDIDNDGIYTSTQPIGYTGPMDKYIQSGQAFMVETDAGVGSSSITFNENNKSSTHSISMFRPASPTAVKYSINTSLYFVNPDKSTKLVDGNLAEFDNNFNNTVDLQDAMKFSNINENFSLLRNNALLSMERRQPITTADTLFFNLARTTQRNYRFVFQPKDFDPSLIAFVEDTYLGTKTMLNLFDISTVDFTVSKDVKSAAANRFRIVFSAIPFETLPVTFKTIRAYQQSSDIAVEWTVENELNIAKYEVEKSIDGINFSKINATPATTASGNKTYKFLDINAVPGSNFYRVVSLNQNGTKGFSSIVMVKIGKFNQSISVYPNPITGNTIGVSFLNMDKGMYQIRLLNTIGQVLLTKQLNHTAGSSMETVTPTNKLSAGIYQLEVTAPDKTVKAIKVVVQ